MAKKEGKGLKTLEREEKIIDISSKHTDKEIVALEEGNYRLRFDEKDFRELSEKTIEKLGHANARDYFIALGAHRSIKKNEERKRLGFEGLEIIEDPFKSRPRSKLVTENVPKGMHLCWKRPDEVEGAKQDGYAIAPESVKAPGATRTSTSHVIARKDGTDDLVLMMVPERLFQQHLQANAIESRKRAGATMKETTRLVARANKELEAVENIPNMTETTETEDVPLSREVARARSA